MSKKKTKAPTAFAVDLSEQKEIKKKKVHKKSHFYKLLFIILTISLIFALIAVFTVGRVIAQGDSEELKIELCSFLEDNGLSFLSSLLFGEDPPRYSSELPPSAPSDNSGITVMFSGDKSEVKKLIFTEERDGYSGIMLALSDPTRLSIGRSTQSSNVISEIFKVERATLAFPFSDGMADNVLVNAGTWSSGSEKESYGYFGFSKDGVMHFGDGSRENIEALGFEYATEQKISALISGGVPCDFESSLGEIGMPTISVAQCADGSVLVLFLNESASCREITELLYRYSAVNAAIIYTGDCAGYVDNDNTLSFSDNFDHSEFTCVWIIN